MELLGSIFLFLHIGGAIAAFGPTIAFPLIASRAASEPMHGNFTLRTIKFVVERLVEPGAVFVFLMGLGLIWARSYNPFTTFWLGLAIIIFIANLTVSFVATVPTVKKMIALTSQPPMPPAGAPGAPGAAPAGPPPEFVALAQRSQLLGQIQMVGLFAIVFLMIFKPTL